MATLRWQRASGGEQTIRLDGPEVSIGREAGNTVKVDSTYVSKRHAVVRATPGGFSIADLGSSNGTLVNGQPITQASLKQGDAIQIGQEQFVFEASAPASPTARAAAPVEAGVAPARKGIRPAVLVGAAACLVILLGLLLMVSRSTAPPADNVPASVDVVSAPPAVAPAAAQVPVVPAVAPAAAPDAAAALPQPAPAPATAPTVPGPPPAAVAVGRAAAAPGASAGALYDLAISNIKGGRLVEARDLLAAALTRESGNVPARERLRQVEAAIQIEADRHMNAGQRAFTYLKYQDAIIEWEQVVAMTAPADPRNRQAAEGIQRARARLAPQ